MNIIKRELKASWKNLVIWLLAFLFMSYAAIVKYESIITTGPEIVRLLESFPRIVLALFNMADVDITTLPGYFSIVASYLLLMAASHGLFLGISLFSREELDKTADFLLVKPRSRTAIFGNKVTAGLIMVLILQVGLVVINTFALKPYLAQAKVLLFNYTLAFLVVHILFFSLGVWLISWGKHRRVETIGLGVILGCYFTPVFANLSDKLTWLKDFFPFNTFLREDMALTSGTPYVRVLIILVISLGLLWFGCQLFMKKDILN